MNTDGAISRLFRLQLGTIIFERHWAMSEKSGGEIVSNFKVYGADFIVLMCERAWYSKIFYGTYGKQVSRFFDVRVQASLANTVETACL